MSKKTAAGNLIERINKLRIKNGNKTRLNFLLGIEDFTSIPDNYFTAVIANQSLQENVALEMMQIIQ
jgi:hypothetical protein